MVFLSATRKLLQSATVSRRFFSPTQHLWYQAVKSDEVRETNNIKVQIGITEHGLDHLGDITAVEPITKDDSAYSAGQDLIRLKWEGFTHTHADELYHTVWESIEGEETVGCPVNNGHLVSVPANPEKEEIDEDTILVEVTCTPNDWEQAVNRQGWVEEQAYNWYLTKLVPGKFADDS